MSDQSRPEPGGSSWPLRREATDESPGHPVVESAAPTDEVISALRRLEVSLGDIAARQEQLELNVRQSVGELGERLKGLEQRMATIVPTVLKSAERFEESTRQVDAAREELATEIDSLGGQLRVLEATVAQRLPALTSRQQTNITEMEGLLVELRDRFERLDASTERNIGSLESWRDGLSDVGRDLGAELGRSVDSARRRLIADTERSTTSLELAAARVEQMTQTLDRLEEQLAVWSDATRRERRQILADTVALLVDRLTPRQRRKVADRLLSQGAGGGSGGAEGRITVRPELLPASSAERPPAGEATSLEDLLSDVPGLGPARRRSLTAAFGNPARMARASIDEIAAQPGMSRHLAETVRERIRDQVAVD